MPQAAAKPFPREEALSIASLPALTGGYLDAYTWIVHRAFANAQTANLVFLWVYMTGGEWAKALMWRLIGLCAQRGSWRRGYVRKVAPGRAPEISVLTEVVFLFVTILHNRLPQVAGTLGVSFVAAFQTTTFPKVEGWSSSSVMATSNFRYTIEGLFAAFAGSPEARPFRRPYVFGAMCIAFGMGAAIGAVMTEVTRAYSLATPVILLVIVLLLCDQNLQNLMAARK